MTDKQQWTEDLEELLNEKADAFDKLCEDRHFEGQKEYGAISFLGNDVVRMMLEELADTTNYCRMQGIKLLILQERLEEQVGQGMIGEDINMDFTPFKGTKETGWGQ
jgi:hypothetical protein